MGDFAPSPEQSCVRNRLLAALTPEDYGALQPSLEHVDLEFRDMLFEAGSQMPFAYFLENGIVSVIADTAEGRIEIGMVGREGLAGHPIVLGVDVTPHAHLVQAVASALRIPRTDLRAAMDRSPALRDVLLRYAHAFMVQASQTAYANAGFIMEARLARWILMTHDRVGADELPLTHEFLSMMLGVRRPGVTVALQVLEGNGLIRATRGLVTVRDRAGLEAVADEAYGLAEAEYARVMSQPAAGSG